MDSMQWEYATFHFDLLLASNTNNAYYDTTKKYPTVFSLMHLQIFATFNMLKQNTVCKHAHNNDINANNDSD